MFNKKENRKPGFKLALFACGVAIIVIGLGAFTRLVDAGLGCPDWPTCYGHALWPETAHEVHTANQAYPDMPVEHDKTWPEMVHRYFATSLGFITILLLGMAIKERKNELNKPALKLSIFLLAFIILQGLFGMWTVTLKLWPQVVTLHLLGGFTTFSLLWLLTLRLNNYQWRLEDTNFLRLQSVKPWALIGLIVVFCQIALGGWTTSNYAAVACPDLPTCQAQWLPVMDFSQAFNLLQEIGPNYLGGSMSNESRIAIHFSHRMGAIFTALYLVFLAVILFRKVETHETKTIAKVILLVLTAQVTLGLANVYFNFPVAVAVAHNLVGALLLITMVTLNHRIFTVKKAVV